MKISFFIFMLSGLFLYGQSTFHDPSLDSINGSVGNVDADLNGYLSQELTISNVNQYGGTVYTNAGTYTTNITLTAEQTNTLAISNAFNAVLGGLTISNAFSGIYTNSGPNTNSVLDLGVFNGQDYTMDFSSNSLSTSIKSTLNIIYNITLSFIYLLLFIFSFSYLQKDFLASMNQRQMSGLTQSIFGFNASAPTALIYCALIVAALVAMLSLVVTNGFIKLALQSALALSPELSLFTTMPGWDVLVMCFPITQAMSAYFTYLAFRYVFAFPLFLVVRCVQLFLIR